MASCFDSCHSRSWRENTRSKTASSAASCASPRCRCSRTHAGTSDRVCGSGLRSGLLLFTCRLLILDLATSTVVGCELTPTSAVPRDLLMSLLPSFRHQRDHGEPIEREVFPEDVLKD